MNYYYKKNATVNLIGTDYLQNTYQNHGSWQVKIVRLIPEEEWLNHLVPEYEVMYNRKRYKIPQYSINTNSLK